ncbi:polysaccharide deacetylase family protein [Tropicimonas sp. TH_r6]|uniref:polysaccharide deacetylase family protein n=1 Tax=Tropicimonas sp. TH_r6 TaxID=3082085 RepID=UPI0029547D59|nr:polysaccharide deacetylase family protein [Tropicimonas sp. TH_r6]MDV7143164.1 polysaccharide deacetylase family protein [Tropicimonas sp. TH_r6]
MKHASHAIAGMALGCLTAAASWAQQQPGVADGGAAPETTNGLIYLINANADEEIDGLLKWEGELRSRGLTAMIKASGPVLETYPQLFRRLAQDGSEIIGGSSQICWDMPYEDQYREILTVKTEMEALTDRPMQVFACKYSSYDENTVRAAEALGVPYVLARGTEDVRALIYRPQEYDVGLIEVSNVAFADMGRGSLCDISLFARGASEDDFARAVEASVAKAPDSMILVSHPHIGGTKVGYWNVYAAALSEQAFTWRRFDDWLDHVSVEVRPYAEIPENREVKYLEPTPAVPLDQLADLPEVGEKLVIFHNGLGPMCLEAKAFLEAIDYPVEEHLDSEKNFQGLLDGYLARYPESEGVSEAFGYYPIIFLKGRAFSGFDATVQAAIGQALE